MTVKNEITETLRRLEKLMYGYNYEVTCGLDIFDNCGTIDAFQEQLNERYKKVKAEGFHPILFDEAEFWEEVNFGLNYRGDDAAGLKLTTAKEEKLLNEQERFKTFINNFIGGTTKIYSYPDELGIGGYEVYWGFTFLLLNVDKPSLLIYASASD
jgi:hypothetical protein